ncbi:MAG: GDSL-type esterase/lipase family protein [Planctomycetaceae bacterium]
MHQLVMSVLWLSGLGWLVPPQYSYGPYNEGRMDPQVEGWPLTAEERAYVVERAEHERRPGREALKHLPKMWPVVPAAGHWGGASWLETHEKLVRHVQAHAGPCDVLLVGDSITQQWGSVLDSGSLNAAWRRSFGELSVINIGIGGDKTQNILWRLDHGGVAGLQPKVIVLMIGNNNMFFVPETGVEAAAAGVRACVQNLRGKFPAARIAAAKILPAHAPGHRFYEDIVRTNAAIDSLDLAGDAGVRVVDPWSDFTEADGQLRLELYEADRIHLSEAGYEVLAKVLSPVLADALRKN